NRNNTVYLKVVNSGNTAKTATITLRGLISVDASATASVLTSRSITDQNSFGQPVLVAPTTSTITGVGSTFTHTFRAYSWTVLTLTGVAADAPNGVPLSTSQRHAFQSVNYPDRSIRHRNFQGYLDPISATSSSSDKNDATFIVVPSLDPRIDGGISFASVNFP